MKKLISLSLAILLMTIGANSAMAGVVETDPVAVEATVAAGVNSLDVTPEPWDWTPGATALPAANSTTYRFSSGRDSAPWTAPGPLNVEFFPAAPYEIRVSTDHDWTSGDKRGYLTSGTKKLYLKVWCSNFGAPAAPVENGPDPMNSYFWKGLDFIDDAGNLNPDGDKEDILAKDNTVDEATVVAGGLDLNGNGVATDVITSTGLDANGDPIYVDATHYTVGEEASWIWVLELDSMDEGVAGEEYTRRRLSWNHPKDADLGSPFKVHMAIDLRSVDAGTYGDDAIFELYTY